MHACGVLLTGTLLQCAQDQVARKVALTEEMLEESIDGIRAAVQQSFPGGLPEDDPVWRALSNTEALTGTKVGFYIGPETQTSRVIFR